MPDRLWVYHAEHESKIIKRRELKKYLADDWRESPAELPGFLDKNKAFLKECECHHKKSAADLGDDIDDVKARKLAVNELGGHQAAFVEKMNKNINNDKWIKEQRDMLEDSIKKDFGIDPDMRKYRGYKGMLKLDKYYRELQNGNS
ncbi:MAG: hypothetical protein CMI54_01745 [Parcubacteria group bacterium]|jgi:DNA-binding ferritin-like protein (Dps family)|nr:hypothetical protein [Parcubacteria group bacterium]|tara:strand:- start:10541 stop:10978 length:438 start_codon:yes stop_codon:yes gene_type:complete